MSYKAIIADDERELRTYLKSLLAQTWPDLEICGEAANGREALNLVDDKHPDIAFLDIQMPGLSGLDAAKVLAGRCHIVFVTAYDQYAVEAFDREAVDYLVKPVTRDRLIQTATRLKKLLSSSTQPVESMPETIQWILENFQSRSHREYLAWINVQHKQSIRLIPVEDIDYFKAEDKYTLVMTASGEFLIKKTIKELAQELDPRKFRQIHRGTLVKVSAIEGVNRSLTGRGLLKLKNRKELLTVSRQYLHLFKQM
jgi:DNA-binding LytR/AlgR family response regulator